MQYPSFSKDLAFVASHESTYFVLLAKDLIKGFGGQDPLEIFKHKNTYGIKERLDVKSHNAYDFRINLKLGYCSILNISNEIFERPFLAYYLKDKNGVYDGGSGKMQVIDKFEVFNVNPYILVLEDKSILNIYSYLEQDKQYRFEINECKPLSKMLNIV